MNAAILKVFEALAKMRGTTIEHEIAKHNVGKIEARRLLPATMAFTEAERGRRLRGQGL